MELAQPKLKMKVVRSVYNEAVREHGSTDPGKYNAPISPWYIYMPPSHHGKYMPQSHPGIYILPSYSGNMFSHLTQVICSPISPW